jgi:hypothetical protein
VAPVDLGDYFSWGDVDGRDLIVTIRSNFYFLRGNTAVLPARRVPVCPGIGIGERPLASRDGKKLTVFVRGALVVRNRENCDGILQTGIPGGKADFSADGRYIAFHAPKPDARGYEVQVIDLEKRTLRRIGTNLPGSSEFPSWTDDGRLSFRYDATDYHGFVMVTDVLAAPEAPLPAAGGPQRVAWPDLFPRSPVPQGLAMVLVWSTWSAHSEDALRALDRFARQRDSSASQGMAVARTLDIASRPEDAQRMIAEWQVRVPDIERAASTAFARRTATQMPMYLLFDDGQIVGEKLGAQTAEELAAWSRQHEASQ